jgi:hypothetical protein
MGIFLSKRARALTCLDEVSTMPLHRQISLVLMFLLLAAIGTTAAIHAADAGSISDYAKIRAGMNKLSPLLGKWNADAVYADGHDNIGTYDVHWALDDTYLEMEVDFHRKNDPSQHHGFVIYLTYNPATRHYESTYFYTRWAMRVTESGEFDDVANEFRTTAFIPLEDGKRDEHVRTITELKNPNKIIYDHYSRYSDQSAERMDVRITLTRP